MEIRYVILYGAFFVNISFSMQNEASRAELITQTAQIINDTAHPQYHNSEGLEEYLKQNSQLIHAHIKHLNGCTLLHIAVQHDWMNGTKILLTKNSDPDAQDHNGNTPLHWAAQMGHAKIALILIEYKATISAQNQKGETPLHDALRNRRNTMVTILLAHKAQIGILDHDGWSPLSLTANLYIIDQASSMVREFLRIRSCQQRSDYHTAFKCVNIAYHNNTQLHFDSLNELLKCLNRNSQFLITTQDEHGDCLLHIAAEKGWDLAVRMLLAHHPHLEARDMKGMTPLNRAARASQKETVLLLLEQGADIDTQDVTHASPFTYALKAKNNSMASLLLTRFAYLEDTQTNIHVRTQCAIPSKNIRQETLKAGEIRRKVAQEAFNKLLELNIVPKVICNLIAGNFLSNINLLKPVAINQQNSG